MFDSFMVARDGQQYGPYSKSDLLQYLRKGEVFPEDLVWSEGMTEWKALQDVVDLSVSNTQHSNPISGVTVDQISENEVIMHCSSSDALLRIRKAMELIGSVSASMTDQRVVSGKIKYGLQSVKIRVSIVERELGKVNAVIQGSSDDIRGVGAKSAAKRLIETLRNLDNPGYKPDRLGVHPVALVGVVIGFVVVLSFLTQYLSSPSTSSNSSFGRVASIFGSNHSTLDSIAEGQLKDDAKDMPGCDETGISGFQIIKKTYGTISHAGAADFSGNPIPAIEATANYECHSAATNMNFKYTQTVFVADDEKNQYLRCIKVAPQNALYLIDQAKSDCGFVPEGK